MPSNYDQLWHVIPLVSPVDLTTSDSTTDEVDFGEAVRGAFYCFFGTITSDSTVVTLEKCTNTSGGSNTAIAFNYRISAAAGTDTMGAITAATSAGVTMTASDDDKILIIEVDPAALEGYPYCRVVATTGGSTAACEYACWAMVLPRNAQNIVSSLLD